MCKIPQLQGNLLLSSLSTGISLILHLGHFLSHSLPLLSTCNTMPALSEPSLPILEDRHLQLPRMNAQHTHCPLTREQDVQLCLWQYALHEVLTIPIMQSAVLEVAPEAQRH